MTQPPIAITGMHRTGTSMVTRALHDSGLRLLGDEDDALIEAAEDNPEGFWEHKAIVACNEDLLEATGGAWDNPPAFPAQGVDDPRVGHVVDAATAALAGLRANERWGFKDPRTCLTAAFWLDLEPDLHFVICVRHPLEVALSLKRRNQNSYSLGLALWERYYATVLDLVPPERRIVTHYDTFFTDPQGELRRLCEFAGLEPARARVRDDLRHHTVGITLGEADVSSSIRALYADLCREAGVAVPQEGPTDEGRVRRLILDGAVAARHAEQRQAAIDRLHEREAELRAEHAEREQELRATIAELREEKSRLDADHRARARELEATIKGLNDKVRGLEEAHRTRLRNLEDAHRERVRKLELQVATASAEADAQLRALHAETTKALEKLTASVTTAASTIARTEAAVAQIDARTAETARNAGIAIRGGPTERMLRRRAKRVRARLQRWITDPARRGASKAKRVAVPGVRAAARQLPPPAQRALRRGRAVVRDPKRNAVPAARVAVRHLPTPAQRALRTSRSLVRDTKRTARPRAVALAKRLPPGMQVRLRRARSTFVAAPPAKPVAKQPPAPRKAATPVEQATVPKPPRGPALRQWKGGYERLVAANVPETERWLVVQPGSPPDVRLSRATPFPAPDGRPLADDLAHIANLEALRFDGHARLVVPEGSRPWWSRQADLRRHLTSTYRLLTDEDHAGIAFDLRSAAGDGQRSLLAEVNHLAAGLDGAPAVLDWTTLGVADELIGITTFRPPAGHRLPYLDGSIDIVVVEGDRDHREAARVATLGVVTVERGENGHVAVRHVDTRVDGGTGAAPRTLLWSDDPGDDAAWREALAERAAAAGAELRLAPFDAAALDGLGDAEVLVFVEPYVLPLPGAVVDAAAFAHADPDAAVSAKVLTGDGRIESAGGMVFADRSIGLVAHGSADVRAPWHDYVRPVCWAPGLVAGAAPLWQSVPAPDDVAGRAFVREWCSAVWASGRRVRYQPSLAAVRVKGDGGEASTPLLSSSWQRVLDLRPTRPSELTDGHWRYLLAHDDVEACRA